MPRRDGPQPARDRPGTPAATPDRPGRSVAPFLQTRVKMARQVLGLEIHRLQNEIPLKPDVFDEIARWSRQLMEDRLRLAATSEERLEAIREHRTNMACLEQLTDDANLRSLGGADEKVKAMYHRAEADQLLAEAGGDPEKEKPVVDLKKFLDPTLPTPAAPPSHRPPPPPPPPPQ
jgi:hypothetical protein